MTGTRNTVTLIVTAFLAVACATTEGTRPDDMSHSEHLAAAEREMNAAQHNLDGAVEVGLLGAQSTMHEALWERHQKHAQEHSIAAEALSDFHDEACSSASHSDGHCPLMAHQASIQKVERLADGIAAIFPAEFPKSADDVENQALCHYAQGRMLGREGMPECPFFNNDLVISVEKRTDGSFMLFVRTEDEQSLANLYGWASTVVPTPGDGCNH